MLCPSIDNKTMFQGGEVTAANRGAIMAAGPLIQYIDHTGQYQQHPTLRQLK